MGKVPRPLEPLVNILGSLPTDSYVLALKSAALHLQVRSCASSVCLFFSSRTGSSRGSLSLTARTPCPPPPQGRDEDIDPAELSGNLGSCDLGESNLSQVR
jgi:hypothetical protein